jgi:hypothetical protein
LLKILSELCQEGIEQVQGVHRTNTFWSVGEIEEYPKVTEHSEGRNLCKCALSGCRSRVGKPEGFQEFKSKTCTKSVPGKNLDEVLTDSCLKAQSSTRSAPKEKEFRHKNSGGGASSCQEGTRKSFEGRRKSENLQGLSQQKIRGISIVAHRFSARRARGREQSKSRTSRKVLSVHKSKDLMESRSFEANLSHPSSEEDRWKISGGPGDRVPKDLHRGKCNLHEVVVD